MSPTVDHGGRHVDSPSPVSATRRSGQELRQVIRSHRVLIAGVGLYLLARIVVWAMTGAPELAPGQNLLLGSTGIAVIVCWTGILFLAYVVRVCFLDRTTGGLLSKQTWTAFHRDYTTPSRLVNAALVVVLYTLASDTFVSFKGAISNGLDFRYDQTFARADRLLHGGHDPWALLHPILDSPFLTRVLWINYTYPFFLGIGALVVWMAWTRRTLLRERVLLTMLLMWALLGTAVAAAFPAAGPAFYEAVTGQGDFTGLMAYLHSVDATYGLPPVQVQESLWAERLEGRALYGGISAMPSMHVAMATLFMLIGWSVHRRLGIVATVFAAGILIGSVHLGWHYAVDGYLGAVLTVLLWIGAGRAVAGSAAALAAER